MMPDGYARQYEVSYATDPPLPEFSIQVIASRQPFRCVSEIDYEVTTEYPLSTDDFARLDACRLLGIGQGYDVGPEQRVEIETRPTVFLKGTRTVAAGVAAYSQSGIDISHLRGKAVYRRYVVRRTCDSGD